MLYLLNDDVCIKFAVVDISLNTISRRDLNKHKIISTVFFFASFSFFYSSHYSVTYKFFFTFDLQGGFSI